MHMFGILNRDYTSNALYQTVYIYIYIEREREREKPVFVLVVGVSRINYFNIPLFSALEQAHCALVACDSK